MGFMPRPGEMRGFLFWLALFCNWPRFFLLKEVKTRIRSTKTNFVRETIPPVTNVALNGTSVSYSYSPSLQGCTESLPVFLSHRPALLRQEESVFSRQGDYWTISYQRQVALLKATRGLHYLALLLRNPGREFHACELVWKVIGKPLVLRKGGRTNDGWGGGILLSDTGPILDTQAKAAYKHRLDDLSRDLKEAEQFNDYARAERARAEMDALAEQLASALGLGGRNRRSGSEAERARSAVTKRIKNSITRIGEAIPALGSHLAARVKTGHFCSYNPKPEHLVAWRF